MHSLLSIVQMLKMKRSVSCVSLWFMMSFGLTACVSIPDFASDDTEYQAVTAQIEANRDVESDGSDTSVSGLENEIDADHYDRRARMMLDLGAQFESDAVSFALTDSELVIAQKQLLAMVNAYKFDDPIP